MRSHTVKHTITMFNELVDIDFQLQKKKHRNCTIFLQNAFPCWTIVLISTQKQEFNIVMEKNDKTDTRRALTWLEFTQ